MKNGDSSSARRVDDGPTSLTNFGMLTEPPAPEKSVGDALVDKGIETPKLCLSPVEMCTPTVTGGLLPASTASTVMKAIFSRPLFSWSLGEETKEKTGRTNFNQLAPFYWRNALKRKSRQTLLFDSGGCTGCLRACPLLGGRRELLSWENSFRRQMVFEAEAFWLSGDLNIIFPREGHAIWYAVRV